jgi:pimeloyl-ACP methyl ester carboxylesterase
VTVDAQHMRAGEGCEGMSVQSEQRDCDVYHSGNMLAVSLPPAVGTHLLQPGFQLPGFQAGLSGQRLVCGKHQLGKLRAETEHLEALVASERGGAGARSLHAAAVVAATDRRPALREKIVSDGLHVLAIAGAEDPLTPSANLVDFARTTNHPRMRAAYLDGVGHWITQDGPDRARLVDLVDSFLSDILGHGGRTHS